MRAILQAFRISLRSLTKAPIFTLTAMLTLGLGIGAATAIFTVLNGVVLQPLPYPNADRLVYIDSHVPAEGEQGNWGVSDAGYFFIRDHNQVFESIGAYGGAESGHQFTIVGDQGGSRVEAAFVTASLFHVLGARPTLGRLISAEDDEPGAPSVAVLGYDYWLRQHGGDPAIVGRSLDIEGGFSAEVIGVLEPGFHLPHGRVDIWVPLGPDMSRSPTTFHRTRAIARLRDNATVADATEDLARLTALFPEAMPEAYSEEFLRESGFTTRATPLHARVLSGVDTILWILAGSVGLLLLIASTNVANLVVVRAEGKRRDRAVRLALGAGRLRISWEVFVEALILSVGAAVIGILFAEGLTRLLLSAAPANLPRIDTIEIDRVSVAFGVSLALVTGLALSLLSALSQPFDLGALRDGGRAMTSRRGARTRGGLVVAQVALALVLLATTGLLVRSFQKLNAVDPGLDPDGVLAVEFFMPSMSPQYRRPAQVQVFYRELLDRVANLPGAQSVGAGDPLPLGDDEQCLPLYVEHRQLAPGEQPACISFSTITPGFFNTLRIPLQGHEPAWRSFDGTAVGVVVTRALAQRLWPGEDPIGKGLRTEVERRRDLPYSRVVGVTGDLRYAGIDRPPSEVVFLPLEWGRSMNLLVRAPESDHRQIATAIRSTLNEMDPAIAIGSVRSMNAIIAASPGVSIRALLLLLLGTGAGLGVVLGAVGLFSVVAYLVEQRRVEIGIRMALGSPRPNIAYLVLRQSMILVIAGAVIGLLGAVASTRLLRSLLFEMSPVDPATLVAVTTLLMAIALLATYLPTRRAMNVDPAIALKVE